MGTHVMLSEFNAHALQEDRPVKVVRDRDCEGFEVARTRRERGYLYEVRNRTHFLAGVRFVFTLADVRRVICSA